MSLSVHRRNHQLKLLVIKPYKQAVGLAPVLLQFFDHASLCVSNQPVRFGVHATTMQSVGPRTSLPRKVASHDVSTVVALPASNVFLSRPSPWG
jgi:hypothetical protein